MEEITREPKKREPRSNQKLKLLYLAKILLECTDENHGLTIREILDKLKGYDVTAERKSIYDDLKQLDQIGLEVLSEQREHTFYYHIAEHPFELAELKLLVDAVQSSRFITEKKSNELIKKLGKLTSKHQASQLQRQVYVAGRVKTMNESILINVDRIHSAIAKNRQISFLYFDWNVQKDREFRHEGKVYFVSPWSLTWEEDNYYLLGYDAEAALVKYYRVDKMYKVDVLEAKREGESHFTHFDMADFSRKTFSMFGGEEKKVRLLCENRLSGVMIDRFGMDVHMIPQDQNHFLAVVDVALSRHFLGWIMALGEGIQIIGPEDVLDWVRKEVVRMGETYGANGV